MPSLRRSLALVTALAFAASPAFVARSAAAETTAPGAAPVAVPQALMNGLAVHAARFEDMKRRGAFLFAGKLEEVDGDGRTTETKEISVRVTPRPQPEARPLVDILRYLENGKDKTDEARKKALESQDKPKKKDRDKDLKLPFHASQQGRYVFTLGERDPANPSRVRIAFVPKEPAEDALKGSAWVDESTSEILSMGFSFSKNPTFVDHVEVTIVFGLSTPLGRAPSRVAFDGRGGFLFIRKHYRGSATLSEPRVAF